MAAAIELLGAPDALVIADILQLKDVNDDFRAWIRDRKHARQLAHRFEEAGYTVVRNEANKSGRWKVGGKDFAVYVKTELSTRDRVIAARNFVEKRKAEPTQRGFPDGDL